MKKETSKQEKAIRKELRISKQAKRLNRKNKKQKIVMCVVLGLFLVNLIFYLGLVLSPAADSLTISLESGEETILVLSDNMFESSKSHLSAQAPSKITNITYTDIPLNDIDAVYGIHNGENYIAYTFEIMNTSKYTASFNEKLQITESSKELEEAMRVMIYRNGEKVIYASENKETQQAEVVAEDYPVETEKFKERFVIFDNNIDELQVNEKLRYTIVIWIEGSDPDCKDHALGGGFRVSFSFKVLELKNT